MLLKLLSKSFNSIKILIYISLFIYTQEQLQQPQCVLGKNCPFNQGICVSNFCKCNEGFETLIDETLPADQQIYCNYEQISQYTPIILEIFLPSMGHFVVGNHWLGLIKFSLLLSFLLSSFSLYDELKVPPLMSYLFDKLGISSILGIEEDEKEDDKKDDDNNEDDNDDKKGERLRGRKDTKKEKEDDNDYPLVIEKEKDDENKNNNEDDNNDNEKPKYKFVQQVHDDDEEEEDEEKNEKEEELIKKKKKKNKKLNEKEKKEKKMEKEHVFIKFIFDLSGIFGSLMYFMDLFLYKFKIYNDGNGIAFV